MTDLASLARETLCAGFRRPRVLAPERLRGVFWNAAAFDPVPTSADYEICYSEGDTHWASRLAELYRLAKPGGLILFATNHREDELREAFDFEAMFGGFGLFRVLGQTWLYGFKAGGVARYNRIQFEQGIAQLTAARSRRSIVSRFRLPSSPSLIRHWSRRSAA